MLRGVLTIFISLLMFGDAIADTNTRTKFYNFDDLLINGKIQRPKVLWTDSRQKAKFERLLKMRKDFIPRLLNTKRDPSLR